MAAKRPLKFATFALSLIFLFTLASCSFLSDESSSQSAGNAAEAQKAADDAKSRLVPADTLNRAKADADDASAAADKLKDKADAMRAATVREHKDPENRSDAPNTFRAIQEYQRADEEAQRKQQRYVEIHDQDQKARRDLEQANTALAAAKQRESISPEKTDSTATAESTIWTASIGSALPVILAGLGGVVILGLLFWLTWRTITDSRIKTDALIRGLAKKEDDRFQEVTAALSGLREFKIQLANVQSDVKFLNQTVQTERQERAAERKYATTYSPQVRQSYYEPPVPVLEKEVELFPTSASSLLSRRGDQDPIIKPDPLKGILVKDPDGRGQLVLVQDQQVPGGIFYIVPRITRFQTKEDFYNHYEQFYDCTKPAAGEVWLEQPAVVDKVDGGWRLQNKGILEVR